MISGGDDVFLFLERVETDDGGAGGSEGDSEFAAVDFQLHDVLFGLLPFEFDEVEAGEESGFLGLADEVVEVAEVFALEDFDVPADVAKFGGESKLFFLSERSFLD